MTTAPMPPAATIEAARHLAAAVVGFRAACRLPELAEIRPTHVGVDLVVDRQLGDEFGTYVAVYADVNAHGCILAELRDDAGELLGAIRFERVDQDVAKAAVAALVNSAMTR